MDRSGMPATYRKHGEYFVSNRAWVMRKPGRRSKLTPEMRSEVLQRLIEGEGPRHGRPGLLRAQADVSPVDGQGRDVSQGRGQSRRAGA